MILQLLILFCIPQVAPAQAARYSSVQPTQAELVPVATALAIAARSLTPLWPGFWPENQPFLLLSPGGGMLLVAPWSPPAEYQPLEENDAPPPLRGRAYTRDGYLPGSSRGSFPGIYEIDEHQVYALPPMGRTLFRRVGFYVHEAFHFHQRRGGDPWAQTPEDSIMGLSPANALDDPTIVDSPSFRAGLAAEDRLLRSIAEESDTQRLRESLRQYLASRAERVRGHPDVIAIERRYERREGTAEYVGCRAAAVATNAPAHELIECLTEDLGEEEPTNLVMQFLRWRLYSTGAVLSLALDRLQVPGWRQAIAGGQHLDQVLARALENSEN